MYRIEIARKAQRQLKQLPVFVQERIAEHIFRLGINPRNPALDIKLLTSDPEAQYRLRVGNYRVKFNRNDIIHTIQIIRIGHRKEVYK